MNAFTGTSALFKLFLRRERIVLPIWVVLFSLLPVVYAASYQGLYPTAAAQLKFANEIAANAAESAMLGRVFAVSIGGLAAWRASIALSIIVGAASMLLVIRHTRSEEEAGRRELLESSVVGRLAGLAAALLLTACADLAIGVLIAGSMIAFGLPAAGAIAFGLSAAAGAALAQATATAGDAKIAVSGLIAATFLLRAVGEGGATPSLSWLAWLSPIGWMRAVHPFAQERWWVFALFAATTGILAFTAFALCERRDLGVGLLPPRPGPAKAAPGLRGPFSLAWRLHRRLIVTWTGAFLVIGAVFGYLAQAAASQIPDDPKLRQLLVHWGGGAAIGDAFFTMALMALAETLGVYAIFAGLRLRTEETEQRLDGVLATSVSRTSIMVSHLFFVFFGVALAMSAFGVTASIGQGLSSGGLGPKALQILLATIVFIPGVWVLAGVTTLAFGFLPRASAFISWAALAICVMTDTGGELRAIKEPMLSLSPFTHVPKVFFEPVSLWPLIALTSVAAILAWLGLATFRRRDIG